MSAVEGASRRYARIVFRTDRLRKNAQSKSQPKKSDVPQDFERNTSLMILTMGISLCMIITITGLDILMTCVSSFFNLSQRESAWASSEWYNRRDIKHVFQLNLGSIDPATNRVKVIFHRDQLFPEGYVYNIWRQVEDENVKKDSDEICVALVGRAQGYCFNIHLGSNFERDLRFRFFRQRPLLDDCFTICLLGCDP